MVNPENVVEEHCLSFWDSKTFSVWQQHPVREPTTVQVVHKAQHQAGVHLGRASSDERKGRVRQ